MNRAQLRTILWLRTRLTRNQWARSMGLGPVLAVILAGGALLLGLVGLAAGIGVGGLALAGASPTVVRAAWLGLTAAFVFAWSVGFVADLQRAELLDVQKLLHLPVALGQLYVINYFASLLGVSTSVFVPAMVGLALGLAVSHGPVMLLCLPLALGLVFAVTAWSYVLQGFLATWVGNPRRRRWVVMGLTLTIVALGQLPNLILHGQRGSAARAQWQHLYAVMLAAEPFAPPLWVSGGAGLLAEGAPLFAVLATLGLWGLGALGLLYGHRSTLRFYGAGTTSTSATPPTPAARATSTEPEPTGRRLVERDVPGMPGQVSAITTATLRSLLRAPEVAMICGISLLVSGLASAVVLLRIAERLDPSYWPVAVAGLMLLSTFVLTQFAGNQFGFDRDGLRALLLAPVPRARLLLAKNLATGAVASAPCAVVLAVAAVGLRLPAAALLAALFQAAALVLLFIGAGNVVSILVPYRIASGTLKATNLPPGAMIAVALCQILFPTLLSPVLLGPLAQAALHASGSSWAMRVNLPASLAVALGAAALYRVSLAPLGRWLQRRETVILARVSTETE